MRFKVDENLHPETVELPLSRRLWIVSEERVRIRGGEGESPEDGDREG
jgi:hypothetical protein